MQNYVYESYFCRFLLFYINIQYVYSRVFMTVFVS